MITWTTTSILESSAQTLVNPVNTVGVMGKGLALEFRNRYPKMFENYHKACMAGTLAPGMLQLHRAADHWILNFPTKVDFRYPSKMRWLDEGLHKFVETYKIAGITSIAFPQLGCGNGGLEWSSVKPLMIAYLDALPIPVSIHIFEGDTLGISHLSTM